MSPLTKDCNSTNAITKGSAMRLLAHILTSEYFGLIDRHFRQALLDKSSKVQKASLICGILLTGKALDYVKKWSFELQDGLKSEDPHVVYLTLVLMTILKSSDPIMMSKVF